MAVIHSIARALPEHVVTRAEAEESLRGFFTAAGEDPQLLAQIFANAGIDQRHLARPPLFYLEHRSLTARNRAYHQVACELGVAAVRDALDQAGVKPEEVDLIVDTSCTGVMIPALDAYIAGALGFRKDVRRLPLTEAGCAAGATSLAFASDLLRGRPEQVAVCVAVELPSLTLQLGDVSRANLISSAIFGDGAAALVVSNREPTGPAIEHVDHRCVLFPNSQDVMGFDLETEGFKIILSPRIPLLVKKHLRVEVDEFLATHGLSVTDLGFFVAHPGGTKVLNNLRDVLEVEEADVAASRETLRRYGNLSSASVHFVAKELLDNGGIEPGAFGLMIAMGPGFCAELALLRGR
jgi:alkylresorcinol/alkylpyrone synthase